MIISDFIGFCKSQGFNPSYRARIGECLVFDISKIGHTGRKIATRHDDAIHKIIWFINDYNITRTDLDTLVQEYVDGLQTTQSMQNIAR